MPKAIQPHAIIAFLLEWLLCSNFKSWMALLEHFPIPKYNPYTVGATKLPRILVWQTLASEFQFGNNTGRNTSLHRIHVLIHSLYMGQALDSLEWSVEFCQNGCRIPCLLWYLIKVQSIYFHFRLWQIVPRWNQKHLLLLTLIKTFISLILPMPK